MMADACLYCDQIGDTATKLKQDLRARIAHQNLMAREPAIMKKIDNDQSLTDNELDILWKEDNRSDAIDVMYAKDRNLVDDIAGRAIKSGDETKITKIGNEIKKEAEICVRKGLCGTDVGLALGLGTIATVGLLGAATGDTWLYHYPTDTFYKSTSIISSPDNPIPIDKQQEIPANAIDAWMIAYNLGLDQNDYDIGKIFKLKYRGLYGIMTDPSKNGCTDYTRTTVNAINNAGKIAYTIILRGIEGGEHAMVGIVDTTRQTIHVVDPLSAIPLDPQEITQKTIEQIRKEMMTPENWKPIITTSSFKDLKDAFTSRPDLYLPPTQLSIPSITVVEPQDLDDNPKTMEGEDTLQDYYTYAKETVSYEIQKGPTIETYIAPGMEKINLASNDVNTVIPLDDDGYLLIEVPDGSNIRTIDDLDRFGNIGTKKYLKEKGYL